MKKKVVIVGAGISGLTAASYLAKAGHDVTLLEKSDDVGGLVGSFNIDGYTFDQGIRGVENSGTLFPMLKQLGINVEFLPNIVDMGIGDDMISIHPDDNYGSYRDLLLKTYPEDIDAIIKIFKDVKKISKYMEVLYDIDNPLFLDPKEDYKYLLKTIVPWMFKYTFTIGKIEKLKEPIIPYLKKYTSNLNLIDAISQHFFTDTPAFFALSYLKMHSDYYYPKGGTKTIVHSLRDYIIKHHGIVKTDTEVTSIDVNAKIAYHHNDPYPYDALIWCGDLNHMYQGIKNTDVNYLETKEKLLKAKGNDSLYQMYMSVDLGLDFYKDKFSGHVFYMPQKVGLSGLPMTAPELMTHLESLDKDHRKEHLFNWLDDFAKTTTYEISVPILRDQTLAPKGKSAVIISTLFDYDLTLWLSEHNLYSDFKKRLSEAIIKILDDTLLKGWKAHILKVIEATPLTIKSRLNNTGGAITGWSFHGDIPVESKLFKIARSIKTPFPYIFQSSQWSFSPSGFPTSIVTAKIAANKVDKMKIK
ncbi:MAG: phytoene desaturase family protein [Acholeplasmataceae bacterium]